MIPMEMKSANHLDQVEAAQGAVTSTALADLEADRASGLVPFVGSQRAFSAVCRFATRGEAISSKSVGVDGTERKPCRRSL